MFTLKEHNKPSKGSYVIPRGYISLEKTMGPRFYLVLTFAGLETGFCWYLGTLEDYLMPTKLPSDNRLTYMERLSAKLTGYSYWLDGIFILIYNKKYNSQVHSGIYTSLPSTSLCRMTTEESKIQSEGCVMLLSISILSASSHLI